MKTARLDEMTKGWFVGDFAPTLHRTPDVEVAVKFYTAGDCEAAHHHEVAREFTVVTSGEIEMNGKRYAVGDIVIVEPGEVSDFKAITNAVTTVVKFPSDRDDKYLA